MIQYITHPNSLTLHLDDGDTSVANTFMAGLTYCGTSNGYPKDGIEDSIERTKDVYINYII